MTKHDSTYHSIVRIHTLIQLYIYMINEISRLNDGNNCESLFYWSTIHAMRRNGSLGIFGTVGIVQYW